jgi:hypothetical protein
VRSPTGYRAWSGVCMGAECLSWLRFGELNVLGQSAAESCIALALGHDHWASSSAR